MRAPPRGTADYTELLVLAAAHQLAPAIDQTVSPKIESTQKKIAKPELKGRATPRPWGPFIERSVERDGAVDN
jgi:hypothetical protein